MARWSSEGGSGGWWIYKTARGRDRKSSKAVCVWGRVQDKQHWEKLQRTETKDNQLVRDGIIIPTVIGTDSAERLTGRRQR